MIEKILYTGGGVSLTPVPAEERTVSGYIRLVADENKAITNGTIVTCCIDVPGEAKNTWVDCEMPVGEEAGDNASEPDKETDNEYDAATAVST